jgi:hypothetical protein
LTTKWQVPASNINVEQTEKAPGQAGSYRFGDSPEGQQLQRDGSVILRGGRISLLGSFGEESKLSMMIARL